MSAEGGASRPGVVVPEAVGEEERLDRSLRPESFRDYVGQEAVKSNLKVFVTAAAARGEALDHLLFHGPPGLGKTTLAHIVAAELGARITVIQAPALDRKGDLAGVLTNLGEGEVLFIDEIHRLNPAVEETLYSAMEDYRFDVVLGEGVHSRTVRIRLKPFTLIGATTRTGLLTAPMRDRFGYIARLDYYSTEELEEILVRSAKILQIRLEEAGGTEIASRCRGTPRIANRLLRRIRDFAQVEGDGVVTEAWSKQALDRLQVDQVGLDTMDREILRAIIFKFDGGPVGINSLSAAVGETVGTIEDVHEPFLIQQGYLHRTPQGRVATRRGYAHLGVEPGAEGQSALF